jgi:hypothetical protein
MFNQQANSKDAGKVNVNTRGLQLYNLGGFDPTTLVLDFWNDSMFSIKLHPAKEKAKQTDREKFDYDQVVSTALSVNKAIELFSNVKAIKDAYIAGEETSRYVSISEVNLLGIGTKKIDDRMVFFFAIHKQLNDNRIPQASMYYEFLIGDVIKDYDPKTGEFDKADSSFGEFELFVRYLENGVNAMTKSVAHSIRVVNNFYHKRIEDKIDSIMAATGAQNNFSRGSYGSRGNGRSLFGTGSSNEAPAGKNAAEESVATSDNLEEEIPF